MKTKGATCFAYLCTLMLLIGIGKGMAQDKKQSSFSLKRKSDRSLISLYLDSAQDLALRAPLRAIDKINKAIELSISQQDHGNEAFSYLVLGNIQQNLGQHELAVDNYKKCLATGPALNKTRFSKINDNNSQTTTLTLFSAHKRLAVSLSQLNRSEEALASIQECFGPLYNKLAESEMLDAKRVQADVLARSGKFPEAITLLLNTLKDEKRAGNTEGEIKTLIHIGAFYAQIRNDQKAISYFTEARELAQRNKNESLGLEANNALAQVFRQQKNVDKELQTRNNSIALSNNSFNKKEVETQNMEIGKAYANTNQMDKALPYFEKSLLKTKEYSDLVPDDLFGKSKDLEGMANIYKLLAEEYLRQNESEKALAYVNAFVKIQDSIRSIRQRELDEALKISNQLGKNQQRIDLLEKERKLSERSIEVLKQDQDLKEEELYTRNIIIGSLCFLMAFMGIAVAYVLKSSREKRRINQLLAIKSLRGQMNPHFIFNALNSVNHYISQNDERAANKYLSDFSKLMRSVMETSKHDLILLSEEIEILKLYLQLEHARFKENFDYSFNLDESIDISEFELPPMIIQPFIENAVWHGLRYIEGKGLLEIRISNENGNLLVSITDNGIGRKRSLEIKTKNQKLQHSTGMQNIENRIRIMNELFKTNIRVQITDAFPNDANSGTKVELFIPKKINKHA